MIVGIYYPGVASCGRSDISNWRDVRCDFGSGANDRALVVFISLYRETRFCVKEVGVKEGVMV